MDMMISVWTVVEHVSVASSAAELAIFTAILYWFFTSSRVADMLEVVGERVGVWSNSEASSMREALRSHPHRNSVFAKLDADRILRNNALFRLKEQVTVPAPQPYVRPHVGLACAKCTPVSRELWNDPKSVSTGAVINILDIGRQKSAYGGVVSRCLCDVAQCVNLISYEYKDIVPKVLNDKNFVETIEETARAEFSSTESSSQGSVEYKDVKLRVESRAMRILKDISSSMSNRVLKLVGWLCHKAIRRLAHGGCGTRVANIERLKRANAAGLPLVFVPLHRSHLDYILVTLTLYLTGLRPPLVAAGDNMRIPFFGWFLRCCGAFYIRRRVDSSEYHEDPIYQSAFRSYILNSLAEHNNLEFFIEGGRTRSGKPRHPKAGILSVIMDAYLAGAIDDALLVPVTLNYERLVDGNFVREQLGMPKQRETFWSALRGIWRTLNTNHGSIRVDFNQPISLKEIVKSFERYYRLKSQDDQASSSSRPRLLEGGENATSNTDRTSAQRASMVEDIGKHLVYDATQSTALMSTNVVSYVLLTEHREGCDIVTLRDSVERRGTKLCEDSRDLGYIADKDVLVRHALDMLGKGLVRREGKGDKQTVKPQLSIAASIELSYYANSIVVHYAAPAILVTALESLILSEGENETIRHTDLMQSALELCEILSQEFIIYAPCSQFEERIQQAIDQLLSCDVIISTENNRGIEEQQWARRYAQTLDDYEEESRRDPVSLIKYKVSRKPEARAERRRLLLTIRPLLECYATTCRRLSEGPLRDVVRTILDQLTEDFTQNRMQFGEAISTDAIHNCLRVLKKWGVVDMSPVNNVRQVRICSPYHEPPRLDQICQKIYRYNVESPLLTQI